MIGSASWDEYHSASKDDEPVKEVVLLVNALARDGHEVIGFTARPEKWRLLTNRWMLEHFVMLSDILMRADDDFRPATEIKMEITKNHKPDLIIDDREDICKMFGEKNVTTLQVRARQQPK